MRGRWPTRRRLPAPHLVLPLAGLGLVGILLLAMLLLTRPLSADAPAPEEAGPVRVAVLVPYVASALAELDSPRVEVVGVVSSTYRQIPPGAEDLGSPHDPNYERLAHLRPDLVVGNDRLHGPQREVLGRSGAEVLLLGGSSVAATFKGLRRVGERIGEGEAMERRLEAARERMAGLRLDEPVEVLPLFGAPGSFLVVTGSTWLGDLLEQVGFRNVVRAGAGHETFPGYVQLSDEVLATLRPDHVLLVTHGDPEAVREAFRRQATGDGPWGQLGRQAEVLDPELFGDNPGLDLPEAARRLVELHRTTAAR